MVLLNRLCYASGNSEWGSANPTRATAIRRVDNYGAGFLRSGARAVFASGISSVGYVLRGLFRGAATTTMGQLFWADPARTGTYRLGFASVRTPGATAKMDPYAPEPLLPVGDRLARNDRREPGEPAEPVTGPRARSGRRRAQGPGCPGACRGAARSRPIAYRTLP